MSSPGNYLKSEREAKGITLDDIASSTNINKRFLLAIENDRNEELPSHTVTIGFLRAYSTCIGIDSGKVVEKYNDHLAEVQETAINSSEKNGENPYSSTDIKFILTIAGSLLSIAVLVFAIIKISSTNTAMDVEDLELKVSAPPAAKKLPPTPVAKKGITLPKVKPVKKSSQPTERKPALSGAVKTETRLERVHQKPHPSQPPLIKPENQLFKGLELQIFAMERAWINVIIDGEVTKDVILPESQSLTWRAEESFLFSTGNIRGVTLKLNGEPVILPKKEGYRVIKNFLITGDNQKPVKKIEDH